MPGVQRRLPSTQFATALAFCLRALLVASLVTACGGGGGGGSSDSGGTTPTPTQTSFTLSGTISIPSATLVDEDVADTGADSGTGFIAKNNTFDTAQAILNPCTLGGYLSQLSGTYLANSHFGYAADPTDIFKVTLLAGQKIQLNVFDADLRYQDNGNGTTTPVSLDGRSPNITMSLYLQSDTTTPVANPAPVVLHPASGAPSASQTITVATTGDYYIRLDEAEGPSTYVLTVGQVSISSSEPALTDEFVPGEAIIAWQSGKQPQSSRALTTPYRALQGDVQSGQLVQLQLPETATTSRALATGDSKTLEVERKRQTLAAIRELRLQPGVKYVEPNYIRHALFTANFSATDPLFALQWHYSLINLPNAWLKSQGDGVVVAVLDTGVLLNHPDLAGQFQDGYDFISSTTSSLDGDGIDSDPTDPGDSPIGKSSYHGTHVAGTIAALANNGQGGLGVAFNAKIMPLRVLGKDGQGSDADIAQALRYAAGLSNASGHVPSKRADIINMSLGSSAASSALQSAVDAARNAGVIVIAAAGNDGSNALDYPAAFPGVVSVSAVGADKLRAPYSNFGTTIDVAAPGGNFLEDVDGNGKPDGVVSTWGDDESGKPATPTYAMMEGTSMATPHVAGVAALMKSVRSGMTPDEFDTFLKDGKLTEQLTDPNHYYGAGLIDAAKAVSTAINGTPQPNLVASPASLSFDAVDTSATLGLRNGGSGSLTINSVTVTTNDGGSWLSLTQIANTGTSNLATYTVNVDRSSFKAGVSYTGSINVTSDQNSIQVPVLAELPDSSKVANAGRHYLLLIDPSLPTDTQVLQQVVLNASNGVYTFSMTDVAPGSYLLVAGSDQDNDGLVCDGGEACAVYPVRSTPDTITVSDKDISGLDFNTGFLSDIGLQSSAAAQRAYPVYNRTGNGR